MNAKRDKCRITSLLLSVLFLGGCVTTNLAETATDINLAVEKSSNQALLLNILRAMDRRPMYFTAFTTIHGGEGWAPSSAGLTIPFGRDVTKLAGNSLAADLGYTGASFDIGTLDRQEFMRGFTTPIKLKTFDYYWKEGWPKELLWMLFINKFEIKYSDESNKVQKDNKDNDLANRKWFDDCGETVNQGKNTVSYVNDPENAYGIKRFICKSRQLLNFPFEIHPDSGTADTVVVASDLSSDEAHKLLVALLQKGDLNYKIVPLKDKKNVPLKDKNVEKRYQVLKISKEVKYFLTYGLTGGCVNTDNTEKSCNNNKKDGQIITVSLRSPEAILYYLGEIARVEIQQSHGGSVKEGEIPNAFVCSFNPKNTGEFSEAQRLMLIPKDKKTADDVLKLKKIISKDAIPFFQIEKINSDTSKDADPFCELESVDSDKNKFTLKVKYDDSIYGIRRSTSYTSYEKCKEDSTMHTFSIVNQLIDMNKESKELPTAGLVRVIH